MTHFLIRALSKHIVTNNLEEMLEELYPLHHTIGNEPLILTTAAGLSDLSGLEKPTVAS